MQLFLIRHPRPLLAAGICYGQLDVASEDPGAIAARLRPCLPPATPLLCSPLQRARVLAEALHAQPTIDPRLMEMAFGAWEGVPWAAIERRLLDTWAADILHFRPPGGESVAMLQARVIDCLAELRGERFAIVAHAGVIRVVLGHCLQMPLAEWSRLPLDFGSITLLEIAPAPDSAEDSQRGAPRAVLQYLNRCASDV